ncbi:hypothetical protein [Streptomyces sp. ISL-96]|uniref:hypothetical protein n=1 Tax=Streptomyces sp. ISL-96 TaxID=2819191 RepID=UPI002035DE68|nr:hypothetical protein [Streptomyces sp. ISL-96]
MALPVPEDDSYEAESESESESESEAEPDGHSLINLLRHSEGWRVELTEGTIHVAPPTNGEHEEIARSSVSTRGQASSATC